MWNVPNVLTTLRVLAAPLLAYCLMREQYEIALYLFVGAAITDALDGWIARHFHQMTHYGAVMDPLADKLVTLTCVVLLTYLGWVPLWLTVTILIRDVVIVAGAFAYHHRFGGVEIRPSKLGKLHTLLAFSLFTLVLAQASGQVDAMSWLNAGFLLVLASTLASAGQYVFIWSRKAAQAARQH